MHNHVIINAVKIIYIKLINYNNYKMCIYYTK